ncbi:MAG: type III-A CRISPR-associated RAMP protein Csm5 [Candidatus Bipolaricaulaceae bacterium]
MPLKTRFRLAVQVLTPLHIGTGHTLRQDFDYVLSDGRVLRLHEERFLEWISARGEDFARLTQGVPPGQILGSNPAPHLVRYALPGTPMNTQEIRECVKDAFDRPYLPASSLKGALRTVLLWQAWREANLSLNRVRLGDNPKFAAKELEKDVFGKTPHEDLLKALRLADSRPADKDRLIVVNVRCVSRAARDGIPLALEAVAPKTTFLVDGHVDETAFQPWGNWSKKGFLPAEKRAWLDWERLAWAARERARERIHRDMAWAQHVGIDRTPWKELLAQISAPNLKGFPLQIGYGTGWLGTTLGTALLADLKFAEVYRNPKNRMGFNPKTRRQTPLERFPASRRLARLNQTNQPLGWVWVVPKEEP